MKLKLSLLIATFLLCGTTANAIPSTNISVNIAPPNPAPYENVAITLSSFVDNLDSVLISWSVNGKTVSEGIGKKSFSATAPGAGGETKVVALVYLPEGTTDTTILIKPSVMVLLWQANDSYVPPFYRGKALPSPDSEVKVVAIPEIRTSSGNVSPKNMTYYWKKDYTNSVDGSGYGKNSFLFTNDYLEDANNISVTASTVDQKYSSEAGIDIAMAEPKILFYKNDSILGTLWDRILPDTYKIQGPEIVEAAPYFISPKELQNPALIWSWFINDALVNLTSFKKNLMPISAPERTHGTSKLKLEIKNRDKIFQTATKEINVEF